MARQGLARERLIGLFLIGLLLFLPPLIAVFNKPVLIGGIPLLYLHLFAAWAMLIAVTALIVERTQTDDDHVAGGPAAHPAPDAARDDARQAGG